MEFLSISILLTLTTMCLRCTSIQPKWVFIFLLVPLFSTCSYMPCHVFYEDRLRINIPICSSIVLKFGGGKLFFFPNISFSSLPANECCPWYRPIMKMLDMLWVILRWMRTKGYYLQPTQVDLGNTQVKLAQLFEYPYFKIASPPPSHSATMDMGHGLSRPPLDENKTITKFSCASPWALRSNLGDCSVLFVQQPIFFFFLFPYAFERS